MEEAISAGSEPRKLVHYDGLTNLTALNFFQVKRVIPVQCGVFGTCRKGEKMTKII